MPMQVEERQARIEKYLQKVEFASLEELAKPIEGQVADFLRPVWSEKPCRELGHLTFIAKLLRRVWGHAEAQLCAS